MVAEALGKRTYHRRSILTVRWIPDGVGNYHQTTHGGGLGEGIQRSAWLMNEVRGSYHCPRARDVLEEEFA